MRRPEDCLYAVYEETYTAVLRALVGDPAAELWAVAEAVERLAGRPALIAGRAALDAFSHAPMRHRMSVCGSTLDPRCVECTARP